MNAARIISFAFAGISALPVEVQVQFAPGLPAFIIVGMADKAVGESRERVRAALTALGLSLPARRLVVNLSPADLAKEGSHYDLPIALAVLAAMGLIPGEEFGQFAALGELSLDAAVTMVAGVLPAALAASEAGRGLICPAGNGPEAAWAGDVEILAAPSLIALVNHMKGTQVLSPPTATLFPCTDEHVVVGVVVHRIVVVIGIRLRSRRYSSPSYCCCSPFPRHVCAFGCGGCCCTASP